MKPALVTLFVVLWAIYVGIAAGDAFALPAVTWDVVYELVFPTSEISALQVDSDYSAAGGSFEGSGSGVACAAAAGFGTLAAFNDKETAQILTMGFAGNRVSSIAAPRDLATCRFNDLDGVAPATSDFVNTTIDCSDLNFQPVACFTRVKSVTACACGDSTVNCVTETCDTGPASATQICGDGVVNCSQCSDEQCDDGNAVDDGNGCTADCQDNHVCGNGVIESLFEVCDDGGTCQSGSNPGAPCTLPAGTECIGGPCVTQGGDGCNADCAAIVAICGNGFIEPGEGCDDGNLSDGDCCAADCRPEPADQICRNSDICHGPALCDGSGTCVPAPVVDCDDGDPCTDDRCDSVEGCLHTFNAAPCDDGDLCTTGDFCSTGACVGGPPLGCGDGKVCTTDSCDSSAGCVHEPNQLFCDDGVFCNGADACENGSCSRHGGDPCVLNEECAVLCDEGLRQCAVVSEVTCADEGNACTVDQCNVAGECAHTAIPGCCSCGDPTGDGLTVASDCLIMLRNSVGQPFDCPVGCCDGTGDGTVTATDAFLCLTCTVGGPCDLTCPQDVTFRIVDAVSVGALQFTVDFDPAAGSFVRNAMGLDCVALPADGAENLGAFDLSVGLHSARLRVGVVSLAGLDGPTDVVRCRFTATRPLHADDFSITVIDATTLVATWISGLRLVVRLPTSGARKLVEP